MYIDRVIYREDEEGDEERENEMLYLCFCGFFFAMRVDRGGKFSLKIGGHIKL